MLNKKDLDLVKKVIGQPEEKIVEESISDEVSDRDVKVPRPNIPNVISDRKYQDILPKVLLDAFKNIPGVSSKSLQKLSQPPVDRTDATLKAILLVLCEIHDVLKNK